MCTICYTCAMYTSENQFLCIIVFVSLVYKISTHFGQIQHPIPLQKSIQQFSTPSTRTSGDKNRHVVLADVRAKQSAWELSGKFEGDIALSEEEQRNGLINPSRRWTGRVVPYAIDDVFTAEQRAHILLAVDEYHAKTPIRLREYNPQTDSDYIHITGENSGCWSYVGRQGGRQQLNLEPNTPGVGCFRLGTIEHELLHALGFYHQQSATERDDYVTIHWDNIQEGTENNFNKYDTSTITNFGVSYDYGSVMHYSAYAFSKNGGITIEPKDPNAQIGQRAGFSDSDLEKLAKMYENV